MAQTLIALATTTLSSTATSITFGSIPSIYRDIRIVINGSLTAGSSGAVMARFNNDTNYVNYSRLYIYGNGSSAASGTDTTLSSPGILEMDTSQGVGILEIMDYSATNKHKIILSRGNSSNALVIAEIGRWASTAAISTIQMQPYSGSFSSGTTLSVYGVLA